MIRTPFLLLLPAVLMGAVLPGAAGANSQDAAAARVLEVFVQRESARMPGRVEIRVGAVDTQLPAAPCTALEPFIPAGSRLWGRTRLGLRCRDQAAGTAGWSALIPVEIRIFGTALVATRALAAGEIPDAGSYALREIELTREPRGVFLTDPGQIGDAVLSRPLAAGQPLRADGLRARPVIAAGQQVKVTASGQGFRVSSIGRALHAATAGQPVRVQVESGRLLSGTAVADGSVDLRL